MTATPLTTAPLSVPEAVVRVLEEAGIDTVFGMSGGNTARILDALSRRASTIRTVLVRNEGLATSAAEAYARVAGKPAVALGQGSWLAGHGVVGTLEALLAGTPMILIGDLSDGSPFSQHAPYQSGAGGWGSWDARQTFDGMTKAVMVPGDPVQAVQYTQLAIKHATTGMPGPVALLFHSASLAGTVAADSVPRLYSTAGYLTKPVTSEPNMSSVADALRACERPVVLAGGGVRAARAERELLSVAVATGAAVVTTPAGKGTFPEDHALGAGVFGTFGSPFANTVLGEADTVLVVGSKLGPSDTALEHAELLDPTRQRIVQIDVEPRNAAWTFPVETVVIADANVALAGLWRDLGAPPVDPARLERRREIVAAARARAGALVPRGSSEGVPIHPQRAIAELRRALPDDVILCADAGENRLLMSRYFEARGPGIYLQPAAAGGMGYAIPAAIGAKVRFPERVVVAVCGDGGVGMALPGLLTAVEEHVPIIVVIFNNRALGWSKSGQRERGVAAFNSVLRDFDYAAIARAAGWEAFRVSSPDDLRPTLGRALAAAGPAAVEIAVSTEETFLDLRFSRPDAPHTS